MAFELRPAEVLFFLALYGTFVNAIVLRQQEAEYLCKFNNSADPQILHMEFRLKTGGDPINRLVAMVNSTFATSRDEINQTICPTQTGDSGANWTLYDSIPFIADANSIACGGKYDNVPNCSYWVIKAEQYEDFDSYYDTYYEIKCCRDNAVDIYQKVNATIQDIRIVNKSSDADLVLTVKRATDNSPVNSSNPLSLGDSYYLQLDFSCQPKTGNYVEGISTFGVKAKWCMVKQQVNATPGFNSNYFIDNYCGTNKMPLTVGSSAGFTLEPANDACPDRSFRLPNMEAVTWEHVQPGVQSMMITCQVEFCYNSTDSTCNSASQCLSTGRKRRAISDSSNDLQTNGKSVSTQVYISVPEASGGSEQTNLREETCIEKTTFIAIAVVLLFFLLLLLALSVFLFMRLRSASILHEKSEK